MENLDIIIPAVIFTIIDIKLIFMIYHAMWDNPIEKPNYAKWKAFCKMMKDDWNVDMIE